MAIEIITLTINFFIMVAGFSAIFIYKAQKRNEIRNAATLILNQIDFIEKNTEKLKDASALKIDEITLYQSPELCRDNLWEQYQHLFVKELLYNEMSLINDFYGRIYRIEKAKKHLMQLNEICWADKSKAIHHFEEKFLDATYVSNVIEKTSQQLLQDSINAIDNSGYMFKSALVEKLLDAELKSYTSLSGTTVYQKLRKISYLNR